MSILESILKNKTDEITKAKTIWPMDSLLNKLNGQSPPRNFLSALQKMAPSSIIAECKRMSPSKGLLIENYEPISLAKSYQEGGAAAVSVLTDFKYFGGTLEDLSRVSKETTIPILRKDFIIDEYQIYEARAWGADTFLLIAGVLDVSKINHFVELGRSLGMEPIIESHTIKELEIALQSKGVIIGINNRNLSNFNVDLKHSLNAFEHYLNRFAVNSDRIFVCESGIRSFEDIRPMQKFGFSAFLIGETLVKAQDPAKKLRELRIE